MVVDWQGQVGHRKTRDQKQAMATYPALNHTAKSLLPSVPGPGDMGDWGVAGKTAFHQTRARSFDHQKAHQRAGDSNESGDERFAGNEAGGNGDGIRVGVLAMPLLPCGHDQGADQK